MPRDQDLPKAAPNHSPGGALLTGGLSSADRHSSCFAHARARARPKLDADDWHHQSKMTEQKDNYTVQYFINRSGWGIVFECGSQTQAALLRDFPWLRSIRDGFERGRPLPLAGREAESRPRPHAGHTKRRIPTADDRRMGARFHELRLVLRPDLTGSQAFAEALRPPVTAQTVRNWQSGHPIPDKMKRAISELTGCDLEDFFAELGAPFKRETEERLQVLRRTSPPSLAQKDHEAQQ